MLVLRADLSKFGDGRQLIKKIVKHFIRHLLISGKASR